MEKHHAVSIMALFVVSSIVSLLFPMLLVYHWNAVISFVKEWDYVLSFAKEWGCVFVALAVAFTALVAVAGENKGKGLK